MEDKKTNKSKEFEANKVKKGEIRNPKGRPTSGVKDLINELRQEGINPLSKSDVAQVYSSLLDCSEEDLEKIRDDKQKSMILRLAAKQILGKNGFEAVEVLLNRIHGKPAQTQVITGDNENPFKMGMDVNIIGSQMPPTDFIKPE